MADPKHHQLQYTEHWHGRSGITFGVDDVLYSRQSPFQHIQVLESDAFGKVLTLDGLVMMTERDEFVYHEMIAHPALVLHPHPRNVLVVGGGDGGTVRELLRHDEVQHVDLVEIDAQVVEVSRKYFPSVATSFDDRRLITHIRDGIEFIRSADPQIYDLVIVDSTDPVGFAEGLFGEDFYADCERVLREHGMLITQSESPFDDAFQSTVQRARQVLGRLFERTHVYLAHIPTYPMGTWSFTMATQGIHPIEDLDPSLAKARLADFADELKYYNIGVHLGAFALPNFASPNVTPPNVATPGGTSPTQPSSI